MRKVYLSHSFHPRDRELVANVDTLIRSHGLIATNSRTVGGGPLTPEITKHIKDADGLVALNTLREHDPGNVTHPWVLQEYAVARAEQMPAIVVYEKGVPVQGMDTGYEHVELDPETPVTAFLRLSTMLHDWKQRAGRLLKVQLMPEDLARKIGQQADQCQCEYRYQVEGQETAWQKARVRREVRGVIGYLRVPDQTEMIQIRASGPALNCESPYTPLWMSVSLESLI
ncbi:MAG: hypothetical protein OER43_11130 [Gammaproteobacteria bacterium]|nr:hypothetical protein [Gammaproteobacteria bacterium]MDH3412186.1 hypothetical protein [Gammaproteobacteria bacterium]